MSFYDDASLVFLPSGGAGKDGKAYSMKPVPEYGSELVTNGDFATDSDWTFTNVGGSNGWRIADGRAICDTINPSSGRNLNSSTSLVSGKSYKVTLDILQSADELGILVGSTLIQNAFSIGTTIGASYIIDSSQHSGGTFSFYGGSSDLQEIDNVSVREVVVADGDFTFSRGSNLTATRIDSNGLIEKGRENLLLQSNSFDTNWSTPSTDVTPNQSGYDGSTDAWLLEADAVSSNANINQAVSISGVMTASVYAKEGTTNWFRFSVNDSGVNSRAWFDLSGSGAVGTTAGNIIDANIESVGNGYFRCSITFNATAANLYVFIANADSSINYSVGDNIYIQDAQLEQGLVATEHIESGATTGLAGILEDSPRFDYSGGASCPSLLLEPQRSNIVGFTEYLEGTNWGVGGSTGLQLRTSIASPDGNNGVYLVTSEAENTSSRVQYNLGTLGNDHIFSVFIKGTGSATRIRLRNNTASINAVEYDIDSSGNFTLHSENALDGYYGADDYGNGWHRVYLKVDTNGGGNNFMQIYSDVVDADGSIYVWGVQAEDASYITSYIPNHSGGSVTIGAENLNDLDVSSMITSSSFTWFLDLNDFIGSDNNHKTIRIQNTSGVEIQFRVRDDGYRFYYNGIAGGSTYPISGSTTANKFCVSYDGNDYRLYVDGTLEVTTRSVGDSGWDKIINEVKAPLPLKQMLLFPSKLSDAECITLTS